MFVESVCNQDNYKCSWHLCLGVTYLCEINSLFLKLTQNNKIK